MKYTLTLTTCLLFLLGQLHAQYSETFDVPNKGILAGPCTNNNPTSCTVNDFAGVDWTLEGNLSGLTAADDNFYTVGGVLRAMDIDEEICWLSPVLNMTGTASFSMDLTWLAFDDYTSPPQTIGSQDYIDVSYRIDGGSWVALPNAVGGGPRTISYATTPTASNVNGSINDLGASGLTGSTLQIRVCVDVNSAQEIVTIDNVAAVNATTGMAGPVCDLDLIGISSTNEDCPGANDGSITVNATTSNGPITYTLSGPVNTSNQTGVFTDLPPGAYTVALQDGSFAPGMCTESGMANIAAGVDNTEPTATPPGPVTVDCPADIPAPDPSLVTNVDDNCMIPCVTEPWINEFHYDNIGSPDVNEFIEVAGPAGIDLSLYTLYLYDGSSGQFYNTFPLSGTLPDQDNGFGAAFVLTPMIQNQTEGIALVKNGTEVIEFISYEGVVTATDGPAMGMTSVDVGVSESNDITPTNGSLGRVGNGNKPSDFTWAVLTQTQGNLNTGQTITNCPDNEPTVAHFGDTNNGGTGSSADPYIVTRTYRVTDAYGNFINVIQTLTANNCCTAPTVSVAAAASPVCPGETASFNLTGTPNATVTYNINEGGSQMLTLDVNGMATVEVPNAASSQTLNLISVDLNSCPQSLSESATVVVEDNEDPAISCPGNVTVSTDPGQCTASNVSIGSASATDNCASTVGLSNDAPAVFPLGGTTVKFTADDGNGNTADCTITVTVEDNEDPAISCPGNVTVSTDPGQCTASNVSIGSASATDNCASTVGLSNDAPAVFPLGGTTVKFTADDGNGNTADCTITVTVEDNEDPAISCPGNVTVSTDPGQCTASNVSIGSASATDNCASTVGLSNDAPAVFPLGGTTVKFTADDGNGNTADCTITVTVEDNEDPAISCPGNVTVSTDPGQCTASNVSIGSASATDNCASTVGLSNDAPAVFPLGGTTVKFTADDGNGNTADCTITVTVEDNEDPTALCDNITVQLNANRTASITAADIDGGSTDNCGSVSLSISGATTFHCDDVGIPQVATLTVTDANNNSSECDATVTVADDDNPCTTIFGNITWEHDRIANPIGVPDAEVELTGDDTGSDATDAMGDYAIPTAGGNLTLTPSKTTGDPYEGVDVADVTRIQQHVAFIDRLDDGYKVIAADVNQSNSVTGLDAAVVFHAINGNPNAQAIFQVPSWRFVDAAHTFVGENAPWTPAFPEDISLTNVMADVMNQDFVGVKMGDVNGTWATPVPLTSPPLSLMVQDVALRAGQTLRIPFRANGLPDVAAWQFALRFDTDYLRFERALPTDAFPLKDENFGAWQADAGELRSVFAVPQGLALPKDEVIFELQFQALRSGLHLSEVLQLAEEVLPSRVYDTALRGGAVALAFEQDAKMPNLELPGETALGFALEQNIPNPFSGETLVRFQLPEAGEAVFSVHDVQGRLLYEQRGFFDAGLHEIQLDAVRLGTTTGVLSYTLQCGAQSATRRMVLIR